MAPEQLDVDYLVIGGGFGGCYATYKLRKFGTVKCLEAAPGLGGVWRQNSYPGARVDVEMPFYSLDIPEVWETWNWSQRFPDFNELRKYFAHVAKVLDLEKDVLFNSEVVGGQFNEKTQRWEIQIRDGRTATCKFFINCVGTSFKRNTPPFKGLNDYKGILAHSAAWPEGGVDVKGKEVAVVGTGASGLQIIQEWAKEAKKLTVFLRTPNLSLPMMQRPLSEQEQTTSKGFYHVLYAFSRTTRSGLPYARPKNMCFDNTPEERQAYLEKIWARGGFNFNQGLWPDFLRDQKVNKIVYDFWLSKIRPRITDPAKRELFCPDEPPHPFGTKRSSLENGFYEAIDQPNVEIIPIKKNAIDTFTAEGIRTQDGTVHKFDAIALATGYDAVDGGLRDMGIKDRQGLTLNQKWKDGLLTHLGMMVPAMPNMFVVYGPQSPCAFTNGPAFIQVQVDWILEMLEFLQKENIKTIEPSLKAAQAWREDILTTNETTLFNLADSWYNGANVPGKRKEQMMYLKGIDSYSADLYKSLNKLRDAHGKTDEFEITK